MNKKYSIGEKIKDQRKRLGLTQTEVAGEKITRNMLSLIESGKTVPSIDVLDYLAERLGLTLSYILAPEEEAVTYEKQMLLPAVKALFASGEYDACIENVERISGLDDELCYILAYSHFYRGRELLLSGALVSAREHIEKAVAFCEQTIYEIRTVRALSMLYLAVAKNIQSPLLELDAEAFTADTAEIVDVDFFKYVTRDYDHEYHAQLYRKHLDARALMKKYAYTEAIAKLVDIEEQKNDNYNACVMFGVYSDLETCYKQIGDFENAYRYSAKRFTLLSAFNT
jgi:transcriptional regulator with XRE-family HTH domain